MDSQLLPPWPFSITKNDPPLPLLKPFQYHLHFPSSSPRNLTTKTRVPLALPPLLLVSNKKGRQARRPRNKKRAQSFHSGLYLITPLVKS